MSARDGVCFCFFCLGGLVLFMVFVGSTCVHACPCVCVPMCMCDVHVCNVCVGGRRGF